METLKATLVGIRPLIMHNGQLANPRNKWTKELRALTSRRGKTDDDLEQIRRVEWYGGLYFDTQGRVGIPEDNVLAAAVQGAKQFKNGEKAKAGVIGADPFYPLVYDGPKALDQLFADDRFCDYRLVVVNGSKTMRARPIFTTWRLPISLLIDTNIIEIRDVVAALESCGARCGLGDFTPRYGRFTVEQ